MARKIRVLLIDDDDNFRKPLHNELAHIGFDISSLPSSDTAPEVVREKSIDVVLLDIKMPGNNGIETLRQLKQAVPATEIIMLTGYGTVDNAVEAMKLGACDFLKKPCSLAEIQVAIERAFEKRILRRENIALKVELQHFQKYTEFVGKSAGLRRVLEMIDRVADTDSTVLIQGESGVGKELVARAIHNHSLRSQAPFVVVDCGALHENILQSELFGHEKGAYTGAINLKHGLFEIADTGTLFMDEISALQPSIQTNLLRVLETGSFRRVGGTDNIHVNVRVLASTNRNLDDLIRAGTFREDLYFRLNVVKIDIPPLRERKEDIPLLVEHFLSHPRVTGRERKQISPEALARLLEYDWPGNVRELENVLERAIILAKEETIQPGDLPIRTKSSEEFHFTDGRGQWLTLRELEASYIQAILHSTGGNQVKAAKILGIDRKTLHNKLAKMHQK
ncbi:MAG: sigma-54 dependent transcriptional regulator [candidate division KSB1 bacterium]|nr:sigma-54 dependent transcriptional regulator [candidate division KSB1 bacterium]MDZ7302837.1 sigma-54 dependent transcriptional regulator [candidate division KSB1 bacterium]MDZ7311854.1 sigma-54 dependent transcriptional regulator [candidate division KSB1 bacterium]